VLSDAAAGMGVTVVVLSGGFLGLLMVQVCAIMGAGLVIYCEDDDPRLETGKRLGAHVVLNLGRDDVIAEVLQHTKGRGCDLVVDHGQTEAIELGSKLLRKRGRFCHRCRLRDDHRAEDRFRCHLQSEGTDVHWPHHVRRCGGGSVRESDRIRPAWCNQSRRRGHTQSASAGFPACIGHIAQAP
jgi:hypothetical protein